MSRRFGPLQDHVLKPFLLPDYPQILRITNILDDEGKPLGIGDAGLFWHSDTSYAAAPCRCWDAPSSRTGVRIATKKLRYALEIADESHRHIGHEGARPEGETHFSVTIVSAAFVGQTRVTRQRFVYQTLAEELATRVHALSLTTLTPDEDNR